MARPPSTKRSAPASSRPLKRRKISSSSAGPGVQQLKGKKKALRQTIIPIPSQEEDDVQLSEQDHDLFDEYGQATSFLENLDQKGIARSKAETKRLHALNKPKRAARPSSLPSLSSSDGEDSGGVGFDSSDTDDTGDEEHPSTSDEPDSDREMDYEQGARKTKKYWDSSASRAIPRLPIKLANGELQELKPTAQLPSQESSDDESDASEGPESTPMRVEDVATGARFGRPAVLDVVQMKSRKSRIAAAKEQIAGICQEIISDPENSLGLLRRLHTFSLPEITTPTHPSPVANDIIIRKLSILSQLAVFLDVIPGYRIRSLSDKEKAEKVGQLVARTREWEQGLVSVYQNFLKTLEAEIKGRTELADDALHCMCTLLEQRSHFNFRLNLINCIVSRLSRKTMDKSMVTCLETITKVLRADQTGQPSLEIVQVLNRMIKERQFKVHPDVLSCLLYLRLKTELGRRASNTKADTALQADGMTQSKGKRGKAKTTEPVHLSKKAKKALKEKKEIEKEFREAEAQVDKEERATIQTETLKLLFVLYFRILKHPTPTPLLPAALHGVSKFAHLVNINFFKDLMDVLKSLVEMHSRSIDETVPEDSSVIIRDIRHRLLCITTAFELLSGQGEALNIELSDFVTQLYKMIPPLSHMPDIDDLSSDHSHVMASSASKTFPSVADLLFLALGHIFSSRTLGSSPPPWCSAAFSKRLLTAALHWPPAVALRVLDFVTEQVATEPKLEALLSTEDRVFDGVYRPEVDDPQVSNPFGTMFWEVHVMARGHCDAQVRKKAANLANFVRS
ncbi:NOC3p-domain-containing protein [Pluteus cervinus]|uniref:NOC3p-domain-containing protein n=1 Tax=Pluteus cervinus TaxID=181527 RepID=A0ACD3BE63_9AGAR|nr:NOC3p-domain-containing protein [Pluteus cervinus]